MAAKKTAAKKTSAKSDIKLSAGDKGFSVEAKGKRMEGSTLRRTGSTASVIAKGNKKSRGKKEAEGVLRDYGARTVGSGKKAYSGGGTLSDMSQADIDRIEAERKADAGRGEAAARSDAEKSGVLVTPGSSKAAENKAAKALDDWESDRKAKKKALDAELAAPWKRTEATPSQTAQLNSAVRGAGADETKKAQIFNKVSQVNYGANHHMPCTTEGCRNLVPASFGDSACPTCSAADDAKFDAFAKRSGLPGASATMTGVDRMGKDLKAHFSG